MSNNKKEVVKAVFSNENETKKVTINLVFENDTIQISAVFEPAEEAERTDPELYSNIARHFVDKILSFEKE